jgi:glutamate-1-semialdehyde 2,1-aminomutase
VKVAGFTSTGSKRPEALFGTAGDDVPLRMVKSSGCWVLDTQGREYLDFVMALGAVALGYADPEVNRAVWEAVERGTIGSLSPVEEEQLAAQLGNAIPMLEAVRFLKSGAEAVAAAVRVARTHTGRDRVLGCGYHGWLDWCSRQLGVPNAVQALFDTIPFNDAEQSTARIREQGDALACVVIEPVVEAAPAEEWLEALREATEQVGAVLIFDEIKTAFRVAHGGAVERWGGSPDLIVLGKAMANGYPLAAFGGRADLMARVSDTWISSTMATEFVSLAAARATIRRASQVDLPIRLGERGEELFMGLEGLADKFPHRIKGARGIPEMCYLEFADEQTSQHVAIGCARRGLLFKRSAYNFVSLAHDAGAVDTALGILDETLQELG